MASVLSRIEHSSGAGTYISQNLALLEWVQSVTMISSTHPVKDSTGTL